MWESIKRHQNIIKFLFIGLFYVVLFYFAKHELKGIDWRLFRGALANQTWLVRIALVVLGLLGFSVNGLYDINATRDYPLKARKFDILKIGWISQAFNEFIDFGGLTGGALRLNFYRKAGLPSEDAAHLSVMNWAASFIGLTFMCIIASFIQFQRGFTVQYLIPLAFTLYLPLFLFADRIPWVQRAFAKWDLQEITREKKIGYMLVSLCDWSAAMSYFLFTLAVFNPQFRIGDGITTYVFAIVIGVISFAPGGVGAFDVTVLVMLTKLGYQPANVLASLVVLRVCYYIIPWALALGYLVINWYRNTTKEFHQTIWSTITVKLLTAILFIAGALFLMTVFAPGLFDRIHFLMRLVPRGFERLSRFITLIVGLTTVILSLGINAKVRRAYQMAMVLLPIGAGLCLMRGFSHYFVLVILIIWAILYANRNIFTRNSVTLNRQNIINASVLSLITLGLSMAAIGYQIMRSQGQFVVSFRTAHILLDIVVVIGVTLLILFSRSRKIQFSQPSETDVADYLALAQDYGGSEYSHLVTMLDKQVFFTDNRQAALIYRPQGRNMLVLGDPIGDPAYYDDLIRDFATVCHAESMVPAYYEVTPESLDTFCSLGYQTIKIGETAIIDLTEFTFDGKKNKNRRMIRNAMENAGITYAVMQPPHSAEFIAELRTISDEWLHGRKEMSYSVGAFKESYLQLTPIAVLRDPDGMVQAFANLMPINEQTISIDLMRFPDDSVDNVMQMLLLQILQWSKDQGYQRFDLGMAPLANVGTETFSPSRDQVIRLVYEYGNRAYGFKGLREYKNKFRPQWDNRYLIYTESNALPQILLNLYDAINRSYKSE